MKVKASASDLARALAPAVRWARGEQSGQGVLLRAQDNTLTCIGTDSTTAVRTVTPMDVEDESTVLVSARRLFDLVRALQPEDITLATTTSKLTVKGGNFSGSLTLLPVGNFPALQDVTGKALEFDPKDFAKAANQVLPAVSKDPRRHNLHGVLVRVKEDKLTLAASDGVRVAESTISLTARAASAWNDEESIVLPADVVRETTRGVSKLIYKNPRLAFEGESIKVITHPLGVDFPDYKKFMAAKYDKTYVADRPALMTAIGRVNLLADENSALQLSIEDGRLTALVNVPGIGDASEYTNLAVRTGGGGLFTSAYNPRLLFDGLEGAGGDSIEIQANEPLRPVLFSDGNGYKYLLMPVRMGEKKA